MIRAIGTALLCTVAVVVADILFGASLLRQVRPIILSPAGRDVVVPPVAVHWEGPRRMRVLLAAVGDERRDLGVHESPFVVDASQFPRDGGYRLDLEAERFSDWVRAARLFQVHAEPPKPPPQPRREAMREGRDLRRAVAVARAARDKALGRTKTLREENTSLRSESERLAKEVERLSQVQEEDAARAAELERRLTQLSEENRALADENAAIRQRLGSIVPCSVWGYYSFPRPQTIPVTRRLLMVSDTRGRVFRTQLECEVVRRDDVTAASICFCVGNPWGG